MFGKMWKNFKDKINSSLEKLAKENQKTFGNERMDCCNLNTKENRKK